MSMRREDEAHEDGFQGSVRELAFGKRKESSNLSYYVGKYVKPTFLYWGRYPKFFNDPRLGRARRALLEEPCPSEARHQYSA